MCVFVSNGRFLRFSRYFHIRRKLRLEITERYSISIYSTKTVKIFT